jgi:putative PIN family toxin of toxin-antitoxin system
MKVVLDTNVLVAAFATEGLCHSLFELCIDQHKVFVSRLVIEELSNGLCKKLKVPPQIANEILDYLNDACTTIDPMPLEKPVCRDPKDDAILALADEAAADYLITGDDDLLVLRQHNTTLIITPRKFWEISRA